jgi:tripartite-type tricarboxylate transporter receptor subunit TctC
MPRFRALRVVIAIVAVLGISARSVAAQENYPEKTNHVLIGFLAGASTDIL